MRWIVVLLIGLVTAMVRKNSASLSNINIKDNLLTPMLFSHRHYISNLDVTVKDFINPNHEVKNLKKS